MGAAGKLVFTVFLICPAVSGASSVYKELLTGQGGNAVPLQQIIRTERARGPIFIAAPSATVYGTGTDRSAYYCSPSVRAANASNYTIDELVVGITYSTDKGQSVGSTITYFNNIKVGRDDTDYFYQLSTPDCRGLTGEVTILRCVYSSGEDCVAQASVTPFGAIPLRMKPRQP